MRKIPIKITLMLLLCVGVVSPAKAIERLVSIGQEVSLPRYFEPIATNKNRSYHLNIGYFFREHIHVSLSFQFGLDGDQQIHLRFGPEFYLLRDSLILPWIGTKYIYTIEPGHNQGWMGQLGLEKNMSFIFGFENIVLRASTGVAFIYVDGAPDRNYYEIINLGLMFAF